MTTQNQWPSAPWCHRHEPFAQSTAERWAGQCDHARVVVGHGLAEWFQGKQRVTHVASVFQARYPFRDFKIRYFAPAVCIAARPASAPRPAAIMHFKSSVSLWGR
jgi:hypothetical protein